MSAPSPCLPHATRFNVTCQRMDAGGLSPCGLLIIRKGGQTVYQSAKATPQELFNALSPCVHPCSHTHARTDAPRFAHTRLASPLPLPSRPQRRTCNPSAW